MLQAVLSFKGGARTTSKWVHTEGGELVRSPRNEPNPTKDLALGAELATPRRALSSSPPLCASGVKFTPLSMQHPDWIASPLVFGCFPLRHNSAL